jgi:hypothetical protein
LLSNVGIRGSRGLCRNMERLALPVMFILAEQIIFAMNCGSMLMAQLVLRSIIDWIVFRCQVIV